MYGLVLNHTLNWCHVVRVFIWLTSCDSCLFRVLKSREQKAFIWFHETSIREIDVNDLAKAMQLSPWEKFHSWILRFSTFISSCFFLLCEQYSFTYRYFFKALTNLLIFIITLVRINQRLLLLLPVQRALLTQRQLSSAPTELPVSMTLVFLSRCFIYSYPWPVSFSPGGAVVLWNLK